MHVVDKNVVLDQERENRIDECSLSLYIHSLSTGPDILGSAIESFSLQFLLLVSNTSLIHVIAVTVLPSHVPVTAACACPMPATCPAKPPGSLAVAP